MKSSSDAQRLYKDTAACGATPIELVVILYDAAIEDMRRALAAMQENDVEARVRHIGHALIVLQQLQGTLDFQRGGTAAKQFERFYNLVRAKLLESQLRVSSDLMREQLRYFSEVRDCWLQAQRMLQPVPPAANHPRPREDEQSSTSEWNA